MRYFAMINCNLKRILSLPADILITSPPITDRNNATHYIIQGIGMYN